MPLKIVRNDIVKMEVDAVVNTASAFVSVGPGCDTAIYKAAGFDELLAIRSEIGEVPEGGAFITPGLNLPARYIIHAVSPLFIDGESGEEEKLRSCYRNSLRLAMENNLNTIAFPLISTGSFGYPREEGMRIALDEITAFLSGHSMFVYIVVFDSSSTAIAGRITDSLDSYIDDRYVDNSIMCNYAAMPMPQAAMYNSAEPAENNFRSEKRRSFRDIFSKKTVLAEEAVVDESYDSLDDRISHMSDSFSQYLLYLIERKGMKNSDVYKRAVVDKKVFSKIKNNIDYHPNKMTAMCLCVGAMLNIDDTKDLLARAGYALSPCDKTDVIFSYFIEHEIFDIIEIDIALEEHGLPCLIV